MKLTTKIVLFVVLLLGLSVFDEYYFVVAQPQISTHVAVQQLNGGYTEAANVRIVQKSAEYVYMLEGMFAFAAFGLLFGANIASFVKEYNEKRS